MNPEKEIRLMNQLQRNKCGSMEIDIFKNIENYGITLIMYHGIREVANLFLHSVGFCYKYIGITKYSF